MPRSFRRVDVSPAALSAAHKGHPWIFREGGIKGKIGEIVEIGRRGGRVAAWGLVDEGPIAIRILGLGRVPGGGRATQVVEDLLRARLRASMAMRGHWLGDATDAYRLIGGAGDGLPGLVVDRYGPVAVVRLYAAAWERHLEDIVACVAQLPWCRTVYRRFGVRRVDGRDGGEVLHGVPPAEVLVVREHGMRLLVRVVEGQKTGMFLDQREHRALVRRMAPQGGSAANLFAYTGGFSVSAALGGVGRVITVDSAPAAVEDAKENFRLNGLDPGQHGFEVTDAFAWSAPEPLDLLIVDPPSLARGRRAVAAARSAYQGLHEHLGPQVRVGGMLATSSCTAQLDLSMWEEAIRGGLARGSWSWLWRSCDPPDHPVALTHDEARYLKFAVLWRR